MQCKLYTAYSTHERSRLEQMLRVDYRKFCQCIHMLSTNLCFLGEQMYCARCCTGAHYQIWTERYFERDHHTARFMEEANRAWHKLLQVRAMQISKTQWSYVVSCSIEALKPYITKAPPMVYMRQTPVNEIREIRTRDI